MVIETVISMIFHDITMLAVKIQVHNKPESHCKIKRHKSEKQKSDMYYQRLVTLYFFNLWYYVIFMLKNSTRTTYLFKWFGTMKKSSKFTADLSWCHKSSKFTAFSHCTWPAPPAWLFLRLWFFHHRISLGWGLQTRPLVISKVSHKVRKKINCNQRLIKITYFPWALFFRRGELAFWGHTYWCAYRKV